MSRARAPGATKGAAWAATSTELNTNDSDVLALFQGEKMDAVTTYRLEALSALHERKVAALMKSIGVLRQEIAVLKAQSKEHRRSQLIQQLRNQLREQELAVDVLKEALCERHFTSDQVNELVILRTLGGPKRFRPKSREELQNELAAALRRCEVLQKRVGDRSESSAKMNGGENLPTDYQRVRELATTPRLLRDGEGPEELPSEAHLREVRGLMLKLEESQLAESRLELEVAEAHRAVDRLRADKMAAEREVDRARDYTERYVEAKRLLAEARVQRDAADQRAAAKDGELEAMQLEVEHVRALAGAEREVMSSDMAVLRDELSAALSNEAELQQMCVLERERAGRAAKGEVAAQAIADSRVRSAEEALRVATRERERLQQKFDVREREVRAEQVETDQGVKRDRAHLEAQRRRDADEQRRYAGNERRRAEKALEDSKVAATRADLLQGHVDALHHELRAVADARADEIAEHEAEVLALTERCGALEVIVERERGVRDVETFEQEARLDKLAREASRHLVRASRHEESNLREQQRRERAEAGEAGKAAESAIARLRTAEVRGESATLLAKCDDLRAEIDRLRRALDAAQARHRDAEKRAASAVLRATYATQRYTEPSRSSSSYVTSDATATTSSSENDYDYYSELYATRAAVVALTKLAAVYAASGLKDPQGIRAARRELEQAIAASADLETFYDQVVLRLEGRPLTGAPLYRLVEQRRLVGGTPVKVLRPATAVTTVRTQQPQPPPPAPPARATPKQAPAPPAPSTTTTTTTRGGATQRLHHGDGLAREHPGSEREHTTPRKRADSAAVVGLPSDLEDIGRPGAAVTRRAVPRTDDDRFVGDDDGMQYSLSSPPLRRGETKDYDAISASTSVGASSRPTISPSNSHASSRTSSSRRSSTSASRPASSRSSRPTSASSRTYSLH